MIITYLKITSKFSVDSLNIVVYIHTSTDQYQSSKKSLPGRSRHKTSLLAIWDKMVIAVHLVCHSVQTHYVTSVSKNPTNANDMPSRDLNSG